MTPMYQAEQLSLIVEKTLKHSGHTCERILTIDDAVVAGPSREVVLQRAILCKTKPG